MNKIIKCLHCKKLIKEKSDIDAYNKYSPFCSSRCKSLDLGKWLNGDYVIGGGTESLSEEDALEIEKAMEKA